MNGVWVVGCIGGCINIVIAPRNATVVNIQDNNHVGGIHVSNLYLWNSIMLQLDDGRVTRAIRAGY